MILAKSTWYLPKEKKDHMEAGGAGDQGSGRKGSGRRSGGRRATPYRGVGGPQTQPQEEEEDPTITSKIREMEARTRMIYDDDSNTLDMGRRKVTDLSQNTKVFLPPSESHNRSRPSRS